MYPVFIRPARPEDGPRILAMLENLASFEGAAYPPRLNLVAMATDVFTLTPKLTILVAEGEAHDLLGFVSYFENYSSWEGTAGVHIGDLWVEPDARSRGIGAALLRHVVSLHRSKRVDVFVIRDNDARNFYEHLGFLEQKEWCLYRKNPEN
jgi:ribosomal protein S18 acetylase RimI-like enzyme